MYVEDSGVGRPVLAIHGLGGGAWFFRGLAVRLAPDYRVVAVDLPGTGRSVPSPGGFSAASWVADLLELIDSRFGEPAAVIGHSMGTILALQAWKARPSHIGALVLAGGLPEARPAMRERLAARARDIAAHGIAGWGSRAAPGIFSPVTMRKQPELVALFERLFEAQDSASYVRCCEILLGISASATVESVDVPVLAVTGAEDQYAPPDLVGRFAGQLRVPTRLEVIPNCGHLPFLERPGAFARAVRSFLDALC